MGEKKQALTSVAEHLNRRSGFTFKTDTLASKAKATGKRYLVFDASRPGFGVRVNPDGGRSFVFRYRLEYRQRLMTLGAFDVFTDAVKAWEKARDTVRDVRHQRRQGQGVADPMEARRRSRATLLEVERSALTCDEAVTEFLKARRHEAERRAKGKASSGAGLRERTAKAYERILKADFLPHVRVKDRKLRDLTRDDVIAILDDVNKRGAAAADQTAGAIASLCTWAVKARVIADSPARDLPTYYAYKPRDRVLKEEELTALLPLLDGDLMRSGRLPKLALLLTLATGQRSGELLALEWRDVDTAARILTIPAKVAKSNKAHRVPLSGIALEIVGELRALAGGSRWLFPGDGDDPAAPLQQQTVGVMLRRSAKLLQRHGIAAFTPHDMRRTCRTQLSALGVPEMIGEMILNHALPVSKVQQAYAHHSHEDAMRDALDKWSARLCDLRGRPAAPPAVIAFPTRGAEAA